VTQDVGPEFKPPYCKKKKKERKKTKNTHNNIGENKKHYIEQKKSGIRVLY
jgi:hypothetical protein